MDGFGQNDPVGQGVWAVDPAAQMFPDVHVVTAPVTELPQKLPAGQTVHRVLAEVLQFVVVDWPEAQTAQVCGAFPPPRQKYGPLVGQVR